MAIEIASDMGTHYYAVRKDFRGNEKRRKINRFLCIGGPFDQQLKSQEELVDASVQWDYDAFNNAGSCVRSQIWVHDSLTDTE